MKPQEYPSIRQQDHKIEEVSQGQQELSMINKTTHRSNNLSMIFQLKYQPIIASIWVDHPTSPKIFNKITATVNRVKWINLTREEMKEKRLKVGAWQVIVILNLAAPKNEPIK